MPDKFNILNIFKKSKPKSLESRFTKAELQATWDGQKTPSGIPSPLLSETTFKDAFISHLSGRTLDYNAREAMEKTTIGGSLIRTSQTKIINSGLKLQASPIEELIPFDLDYRTWTKNVESKFKIWQSSKAADYSFSMNFGQMQSLFLKNYLCDGLALAILRYKPAPQKGRIGRLCVQIVPKSQLCSYLPKQITPKNDFYKGMEINQTGEVVAYWFDTYNQYDITKVNDPIRIPRWGRLTNREVVLNLTHSPRVGDHYGASPLAVILEDLHKIEGFRLSELQAAKLNSSLAMVISNNMETPTNPLSGGIGKKIADNENARDSDEIMTTERPGMIVVQGSRGNRIESYDTKRPNLNFGNFVDQIVKQISGVAGIPSEILFKSFSSNYSASRAAINEFYEKIIEDRALITSSFCEPVYAAWLHDRVVSGKIDCPGYFAPDLEDRQIIRMAYQTSKWSGISKQNLDPLKEVKALQLAVEQGWTTSEEVAEKHFNTDYYLNSKKRTQERKVLNEE